MKSMDKAAVIVSAALLTLSLAACQAQQREEVDPTEPIVQVAPSTQAATEPAPTQVREEVVELVSPSGESTTVYLLADGRYLDRQDRFFTFDGLESWTSNDGTVWSRKARVKEGLFLQFHHAILLMTSSFHRPRPQGPCCGHNKWS